MKGAAEFQRLLSQFEQSGMANPESDVLYSGAQQQAHQQSGFHHTFSGVGEFAGNFVRKLTDKYKENERLKQEYRDQNPGGYPGMPQNLSLIHI